MAMASSSPTPLFCLLAAAAMLLFACTPLQVAHAQSNPSTDPCLATCCQVGWLFYGEGNYSKLGVNGSSNCNCFDAPVTACPKQSVSLRAQKLREVRLALLGSSGVSMAPEDGGVCQPACCSVGHSLYGYGDFGRLGDCNCAMQPPVLCGNEFKRLIEDQ